MAAIDDEPGKILEHAPKSRPELRVAGDISEKALLWIPGYGWLFSWVLAFVRARMPKGLTTTERQILEFCQGLNVRIDTVEEKLQSDERVQTLAAHIAERIAWGANEKKSRRFAAVFAATIANAETDGDYDTAESFIRALDELSENDILMLRHLYDHQGPLVREDLAMETRSFFEAGRMTNMLRNIGHLSMKRDDFYSSCQRLTGYGLAMPLEWRTDLMVGEHAFRLTLMGKRLSDVLKMTEQPQ